VTLSNAAVRISVAILLFLSLGAVSHAAPPDDPPGKICNDNNDFNTSHSACVVCLAQADAQLARACMCKSMGLSGRDYGQCVSGMGASRGAAATFSVLLLAAVLFRSRHTLAARFKG
jgi:hypothetical protein